VSRSRSRTRRPTLRGLFTRFVAILLGAIVAAALIVGIQVPLLHPRSLTHVTFTTIDVTSTQPLEWPKVGSAALDIPSLGVLDGHDVAVVPVASLTKMMTAYVTLRHLPLGIGQSGPCHVVTEADVATYEEMSGIDESSVPVTEGEQLCEFDLLDGLLVHSAGNYAVMLANMVAGSNVAFVAEMNEEATALGLTGTSYADVTGYSPLSVSTATDQARLAALLMRSPLVRSIVIQTSVTLPYAGVESSFTPDVGIDNVIGVKSGRTLQAGGCDVMAMKFLEGSTTHVLYAVVLGQEGGDLLGPASEAALALANSAVANRLHYTIPRDRSLGEISWGPRHVAFGVTSSHELWWWPARGRLRVRLHVRTFTSPIRRDEIVGTLYVRGAVRATFRLRALGALSPPTLLERLR
jgi:D-alanyl-D-alanine carboxypeptidase (penicillin-binding protein 5/6)